ncbi:hypothetical protein ARAM_004479 [Aspergillus rambellii]|uniref:Major facilitator superfamily (MFS) profile domain-containing protein n=1 Tax=Aspergillus rambellii TaxID=308745 RepID=A0A0F8UVA0_9EURO|nr:hypothetical protein ARAM_004479 [Aspergillus rambellii]
MEKSHIINLCKRAGREMREWVPCAPASFLPHTAIRSYDFPKRLVQDQTTKDTKGQIDEDHTPDAMNASDETGLSPNAPLLTSETSAALRTSDDVDETDDERVPKLGSGSSSGWFIWSLTFSAGISGLLFGYDTGVISSTLLGYVLYESVRAYCESLAGILADKLGRRRVIVVADVLFTLGALIQAVTSVVWELAPSHARGRLVTILSLFTTGGQVIAYIVGWLFSSVNGGWRWMVGLGMLPAVFQLVIAVALPETPRWLVQAGLETKAMNVLLKVHREDPDSEQIAKQIMRDIRQEVAEEDREMNPQDDVSSRPGLRWFGNVKRRAHDLFGIGAMTNFVFTLLAFVYIDKIGRRRILLYSIPVMVVSLFVCAGTFSSVKLPKISPEPESRGNGNIAENSFLALIILLCLTIYTGAYAFGLGNVPWQQSELFPLNVRSLGSALATATNWGSNFIIGLTFLPMMDWLSPGLVFALYGVVCVVGWFGVWTIYPEMSGLDLEEVKGLLAGGWGVRESLARGRSHTLRTED